jgi:CHASE2 domain-containing sensor protein
MRLGFAYVAICVLAFLLHAAGAFSRAELAAYDWLLRSRPAAPVDPRILIVD